LAEWWKVEEVKNVGTRSPFYKEVTGKTTPVSPGTKDTPSKTGSGALTGYSQTRPTDRTLFGSKDSGTRLSQAAEIAQENTNDLYAAGELIAFARIEANRQQMLQREQGLTEVFRGVPKASEYVPKEAISRISDSPPTGTSTIKSPRSPELPVERKEFSLPTESPLAPRPTTMPGTPNSMQELFSRGFVDTRPGVSPEVTPAQAVYSTPAYSTPAQAVYDPVEELSRSYLNQPVQNEIATQEAKTEQVQERLLDEGVEIGFSRGYSSDHPANDYFAPRGAPMVSLTDGQVISIVEDTGDSMGSYMLVWNEKTFTTELYAHIENPAVRVGDYVSAGQPIAQFGRQGEQYINPATGKPGIQARPGIGVVHHERWVAPPEFTPTPGENYGYSARMDLGMYRTPPPTQERIAELLRQHYGDEAVRW
jgi:hypothetical protein